MKRLCGLIAIGSIVGSLSSFSASKTVMSDDNGRIEWPQNIKLANGNIEAVSAEFSNLTVNGISVIVTTGGVISVNGLASNQVGSLSGGINVINDPSSGEVLSYDGANAYWVSVTNTLDTTNLSVQTISASTAIVSVLTVGGASITNFSQLTNTPASWASFPAEENVNINQKSLTNIAFLEVGGSSITNFNNLTNVSNWADFKASGNVDMDEWYLTNAAGIELGGDLIETWQDLTNQFVIPPDTWADYPASGNVDMNGNAITNVSLFQLDGEYIESFADITNNPALQSSNWYLHAAQADVDMGGNSITNISSLQVGGQTITNFSSTTNVLSWSTFPAISDVDVGANNITNVTIIYFANGGYMKSESGILIIGD